MSELALVRSEGEDPSVDVDVDVLVLVLVSEEVLVVVVEGTSAATDSVVTSELDVDVSVGVLVVVSELSPPDAGVKGGALLLSVLVDVG